MYIGVVAVLFGTVQLYTGVARAVVNWSSTNHTESVILPGCGLTPGLSLIVPNSVHPPPPPPPVIKLLIIVAVYRLSKHIILKYKMVLIIYHLPSLIVYICNSHR